MKHISKLLSVLLITLLVGVMPASAGVSNRDGNLTADGDMEKAGTTAFATINSAVLSKETGALNTTGSQVLRVTNNGAAQGAARFNPHILVTAGLQYKISGQVRCSDATLNPYFYRITGTSQLLWSGTTGTAIQSFDFVSTMTLDGYLALYNNEGGGAPYDQYCEWDNISVTRYYGKLQNRDVNLLADGDMEATGTTSWSFTGATTGTKQAGASDLQGSRILRIFRNTTGAGASQLSNQLFAGVPYRITGRARGDGTNAPIILQSTGSTGGAPWTGTTSTSWQNIDVIYTPTNTGTFWLYAGVNDGAYTEWDNMSVTRYYGKVQNRDTQLATDGNAEKTGVTDWFTTTCTATKELGAFNSQGERVLRLTTTSVNNGFATNNISIIAGQKYRISGSARGDGTTTPLISWAGASYINNAWGGTSSTTPQHFNEIVTAPAGATNIRLYVQNNALAIGAWTEFDNVSITRLY